MANRLEHANINVTDIDETIRFLTTVFPDFSVRRDHDGQAGRWVHIGTDDTYLALNQVSAEVFANRGRLNHNWFWHRRHGHSQMSP